MFDFQLSIPQQVPTFQWSTFRNVLSSPRDLRPIRADDTKYRLLFSSNSKGPHVILEILPLFDSSHDLDFQSMVCNKRRLRRIKTVVNGPKIHHIFDLGPIEKMQESMLYFDVFMVPSQLKKFIIGNDILLETLSGGDRAAGEMQLVISKHAIIPHGAIFNFLFAPSTSTSRDLHFRFWMDGDIVESFHFPIPWKRSTFEKNRVYKLGGRVSFQEDGAPIIEFHVDRADFGVANIKIPSIKDTEIRDQDILSDDSDESSDCSD